MAKRIKTKELINNEHFLTPEKAYEYCEETSQLVRGVKTAFMVLAERLHRIKSQKLYQPTYEHFYMYCDEIELHESIASRLIGIYDKFVMQQQISLEEIKNVEYTKLYEIRKVADTREVAMYWIQKVNSDIPEQRLSLRDLKNEIKALKGGIDEPECEHNGETYLVRVCRACGVSWEEFGDTKKNDPKHIHETH